MYLLKLSKSAEDSIRDSITAVANISKRVDQAIVRTQKAIDAFNVHEAHFADSVIASRIKYHDSVTIANTHRADSAIRAKSHQDSLLLASRFVADSVRLDEAYAALMASDAAINGRIDSVDNVITDTALFFQDSIDNMVQNSHNRDLAILNKVGEGDGKLSGKTTANHAAISQHIAADSAMLHDSINALGGYQKVNIEALLAGLRADSAMVHRALLDSLNNEKTRAQAAELANATAINGNNASVISNAYACYNVWKVFPDMIDPEYVFAGLNYLFGCHPYNNLSFVTSVGVSTKHVAYGNNRADYSVIPGGIVPGLLVKEDYYENKDDYPFHWGENECCINTAPQYVRYVLGCMEVVDAMNK